MDTAAIEKAMQEQREQYIQQAMLEYQLYDMMYIPHVPPYVDYMPILREIKAAVVKAWHRFFSTGAVPAGRLEQQQING